MYLLFLALNIPRLFGVCYLLVFLSSVEISTCLVEQTWLNVLSVTQSRKPPTFIQWAGLKFFFTKIQEHFFTRPRNRTQHLQIDRHIPRKHSQYLLQEHYLALIDIAQAVALLIIINKIVRRKKYVRNMIIFFCNQV